MFNRRQFLKTGIAGSALLAAGGAWFFLTHRDAEVDALFAVVGSAMLFPLLTLVLMGLPGQAGADGELAPLPKPMIVAAPVIGVLLALLVSLVFSRLG